MNTSSKIFVDFGNADVEGRVRLNTIGSLADIQDNKIDMKEGLELLLDDDEELSAFGVAHFSNSENIWVASIDCNEFR